MPKRNEKLIEALDEMARLRIEIMVLQQEIKAARREERMAIAREILKEGEE